MRYFWFRIVPIQLNVSHQMEIFVSRLIFLQPAAGSGDISAMKQMISVLMCIIDTAFNVVFTLCTFYDCCNASQSVFSIGGTKYPHCNCKALNTLIVIVIVIVDND